MYLEDQLEDFEPPHPGFGVPLMIFTFGRSGTHMTIDLVRRQFQAFSGWKYPGEPNSRLYGWLDDLGETCEASRREIARWRRAKRPIVKSHAYPWTMERIAANDAELARWLAPSLVIHVVRHPMEALKSAWPLECGRLTARGKPVIDPANFVRLWTRRWAAGLKAMRGRAHLQLLYEDVRVNPRAAVNAISRLTGEQPAWREPIIGPSHRTVAQSRLRRLFSVRPGSTAGICYSDWKERHQLRWTAALDEILTAEAGDELARLGFTLQPAPTARAHTPDRLRELQRAADNAPFPTGSPLAG